MYDPLTGKSEPNYAYGYAAQAVEVDVDIETGHVHVRRVISANDVGRAINPEQVQGQIEGAVVQAQGYAIMENLISVDGQIRNPHLSTYLIPTVMDVPQEVKSVMAPAIIAAVFDATGVWMDFIPLTPDRVVAALRAHGIGSD